jgi:hypothetical protein
MSPKIYFIQNQEGKFYNGRFKTWETYFSQASYEKNKATIMEYLKSPRHKDNTCFETTEAEVMEQLAKNTTDLIIAGNYFKDRLVDLSCRIPTISQVNKNLFKSCKNTGELLKPFSKFYKQFLEQKEEDTDDVSGHFAEYIQKVSSVEIYQMGEINSIIEAYFIDRKSVVGIAKKILK